MLIYITSNIKVCSEHFSSESLFHFQAWINVSKMHFDISESSQAFPFRSRNTIEPWCWLRSGWMLHAFFLETQPGISPHFCYQTCPFSCWLIDGGVGKWYRTSVRCATWNTAVWHLRGFWCCCSRSGGRFLSNTLNLSQDEENNMIRVTWLDLWHSLW